MKRFITSFTIYLLIFSLISCENPPTSNTVNSKVQNNDTTSGKSGSGDQNVTPSGKLIKSSFKVFLDGFQIINGINPLVGFSSSENDALSRKFTFYSTFYAPEIINKNSYATFEINRLTTSEIKEDLEITTDPNIKINAMVYLNSTDSPKKVKTIYQYSNGNVEDITEKTMPGLFKGSLHFRAMAESALGVDLAYHELRIDYEFPYENGKLKIFEANSIVIKDGIGFYE